MNRILALLAVAFALAAAPAMAAGPYKLDAKGNCHDASGLFAKKAMCAAPPPKHCIDSKSHKFAKCSAPGAVPM